LRISIALFGIENILDVEKIFVENPSDELLLRSKLMHMKS